MASCGRPSVVAQPEITRSILLHDSFLARWFFVNSDEEPVYFMAGDCALLNATASIRLSSDVAIASEMDKFGLRTVSTESYPATVLDQS